MIHFKDKLVEERYHLLCERMKELCEEMALYCEAHSLPFVLTETVTKLSEDQKLNRVSASHRTCRAVDISVKGWPMSSIHRFVTFFNERHQSIAATSKSDGAKRLCVYHDVGAGEHVHAQLAKSFEINW